MSTRKMKTKTVGADPADMHMLNNMFDQMTGVSHADTEVLQPKYVAIRAKLIKVCKVLTLLTTFKEFSSSFSEMRSGIQDIEKYVNSLKEKFKLESTPEEDAAKNTIEIKEDLNKAYTNLKESVEMKQLIISVGNLGKYKKYLATKETLADEFIKREPGLTLKPFAFSVFDFKILWASDNITETVKKFMLNILHHFYTVGYEIYDLNTSPNIDISKFSEVLIKNLSMLKKQIPRCNHAFDIIADSVSMLENNFKGYYKSSVEAENPSLIIESFIVDVSMKQKASPELTRQFKKIIMFMKKKTESNNDPRVKKLFSLLNSQFSMMEKETGIAEDPIEPMDDIVNSSHLDTISSQQQQQDLTDEQLDAEFGEESFKSRRQSRKKKNIKTKSAVSSESKPLADVKESSSEADNEDLFEDIQNIMESFNSLPPALGEKVTTDFILNNIIDAEEVD